VPTGHSNGIPKVMLHSVKNKSSRKKEIKSQNLNFTTIFLQFQLTTFARIEEYQKHYCNKNVQVWEFQIIQ